MSGAVLFDLDGTLIDSASANARLIREVVAEAGGPALDEAAARATVGRALDAAFASVTAHPADSPEVAAMVARFRKLFRDRVVPASAELVFPGVFELLDHLRARGRRLAVVTSKIRPSAEEVLRAAGLLDRFDALACHGMAERGKPHPDLALLAAAELGAAPAACVVVGDAVDDVRMALAAGMVAVGVGYGVAGADELLAAGVRAVAGSAGALREVLDGLPAAPASVSMMSEQGPGGMVVSGVGDGSTGLGS